MAATSVVDYTLVTELIPGYAEANLTKNLSLIRAGVIEGNTEVGFAPSQGNTWMVRGYTQYNANWQVPVAGADMDVNPIDSYADTGVVCRRGDAFGVEDASRYAGGDPENAIAEDIGRQIGYHGAWQLERTFLEELLPGLTLTGGALRGTHVHVSGAKLDDAAVEEGIALMGENRGNLRWAFMHSTVLKDYNAANLVTENWQLRERYNEFGLSYGGSIGGLDIILNDRMYNAAPIYHTLLVGPGALYAGMQMDLDVEYVRQVLKAGGTDVWKYMMYFSPHVIGTSFTGTSPAGIEGATDADLSNVLNWSQRPGITPSEINMVVIESDQT